MTVPDDSLSFSWSLAPEISDRPTPGAPADLAAHRRACVEAERYGLDAVHVPAGLALPEPFTWSAMVGATTSRITFMVTTRVGTVPPVHLVQQTATLSHALGGRVSLLSGQVDATVRSYGSDVGDGERDHQADEFWRICQRLWAGNGPVDFAGRYYQVGRTHLVPFSPRPETAFGGPMDRLLPLAHRHGDVLYDRPRPMPDLVPQVRAGRAAGLAVGLHMGLVVGGTPEAAMDTARALATSAGNDLTEMDDGLWVGVPYLNSGLPALVGSPEEIVTAVRRYQGVGVSRFLFNGGGEHLRWFGREILPALRGAARGAVQ